MRKSRIWAGVGATALAAAALAGPANAAPQQDRSTGTQSYIVLMKRGASVTEAAAAVKATGAKVTSVNTAIGMITATSRSAGFRGDAGAIRGVVGVAADRPIGHSPQRKVNRIERENLVGAGATVSGASTTAATQGDPLDGKLWGMRMINADDAHQSTLGSPQVKVGIIDTGVQADHPDIHPNFDYADSRNFVTDIPAVDGPCESADCVDPVGEDDGGHGTHVAGTVAAAMNGFGVSGVAPRAQIVEVRAGQDSGYFFLGPTANALTYSGDAGIDVVNMSFYVDPWLYNCQGGAPEDSALEAADQDLIIQTMNRALTYAHDNGVTMVAAAGNNHEDMANPRTDYSSPDYPGGTEHPRTIDNDTCSDLPVEGPFVLGTTALGPSGKKSDYSNYTSKPSSGEVEFSAPGGYYRDYYGTAQYRQNENMILSTVPLVSLQETGEVDKHGRITRIGKSTGVIKQCQSDPAPGTTPCGYYAYYQGTSMASPHATGVAALAVSSHGSVQANGYGMDPAQVGNLMMRTATDHACPSPRTVTYTNEGRSTEFTATCVGRAARNGFYGEGIVNAGGVVR